MKFFLGTHRPGWLSKHDHAPMFVSHRALSKVKKLKPARREWALDSGGFSELSMFGKWTTTKELYVENVLRFQDQVGNLLWAAAQDWMCEPWILAKTGLTITEHQRRSIDSFLWLRENAPGVQWLPVIQGWRINDYFNHVRAYDSAGVRLWDLKTVGVGTVCRRQGTDEGVEIIEELAALKIPIHGFGFKKKGLAKAQRSMVSADSLAWSFAARHEEPLESCTHKNCANCSRFAFQWYDSLMKELGRTYDRPTQRRLRFDRGSLLGETAL